MREIRIDDKDLTRGKRPVRDVAVASSDLGFQVNEIKESASTSQSAPARFEEYEEVMVEESEPGEMVKVKFDKFVQLVATHNFEEVLKSHANEDIVMNSNLLMDLASAHEDQEEDPKKQPMLIGIGILIGVVAAYILLKFF